MGLGRAFVRAEREFRNWRKKRRRGERIPEELWALAVELAVEHGSLPGTATALSLSYYALKDRLEERKASDHESRRKRRLRFVELPMPAAPEPNACTIELRDSAGTQLTLRFENANAVDVAAMGRSLWGDR